MRVVGGKYRSRPLKAVPGQNTRPTTDKVKESIFNMLGGSFEGGTCLDFYGGSGALAIEAVSRGMEHAIITEKAYAAIQTIRENIEMTKEKECFTVLQGDNRQSFMSYCHRYPKTILDLVFLDPPYAKQQIESDIEWLQQQARIDEYTDIVCETDQTVDLPDKIGNYCLKKQKQYGITVISVYKWEDENGDD